MIAAIQTIEKDKPKYDIEIDGAVIKINQISKWKELGETGKYPRWGRAYKYQQEEAITTVREIIYQVGMSGKITPKCKFDPVFLDGSEIQFATLNNKDFMSELGIGLGDQIVVRKAAGIIPECVRVEKHSDDYKPVIFPEKCPSCGTELKKKNDEHVDFFCTNPVCIEKLIARFFHFTHVMKIDGFSDATIGKLIDSGFLKDFPDLYTLSEHRDKIISLDRMGEKNVNNLLSCIENSKNVEMWRFLAALAIPNVGLRVAKQICERFTSIDALKSATIDDISALPGIGEQIANSLHSAINDSSDVAYSAFHKLSEILNLKTVTVGDKLKGKIFCITGKLSEPREAYEEKIQKLGGKLASSVSKNTTYLVNNDTTSTSTKNMKAKELKIPIISEEELKKLL
jgi:DNA ligase (NAD+)